MKRKHISWKTKCAAAVLNAMMIRERFGLDPKRWYRDAKIMTEDQFLSLFHFDHNILHETGFPGVDLFWNLEPKLILEHREKTKQDAKVIAKSRRIRLREVRSSPTTTPSHKLRSRGFDKTLRKRMDGTVVKRGE